MTIEQWYSENFEDRLAGRYLPISRVLSVLKSYGNSFEIFSIGESELGIDIPCWKIGNGKKVVLGWSQMHGNESTTTKALVDFLKFVTNEEYFQDEIEQFLGNYTFYVVPVLNPDGAKAYTRENANGIDLNRDAVDLSQSESRALSELFQMVQPELCLNLHDQRTIYGLLKKNPATISFLSPAANSQLSVTPARKEAMKMIVGMNKMLQKKIPSCVGRYDDSFNPNCVGDTFQAKGIPTILFEAGHFPNDYEREKTRELIFYAYVELFQIFQQDEKNLDDRDYFKIPENHNKMRDVVLRNVKINNDPTPVSIVIQYQEELNEGRVEFVPIIENIGKLEEYFGHVEIDVQGAEILLNSYENVFVNEKVSIIVDKYAENRIFFKYS
ncbi:MAG: peptidase M14 [Flavobacteriaceae bacterium]|nr:peptidase M14 [Flavobacteriaceae bacterium]